MATTYTRRSTTERGPAATARVAQVPGIREARFLMRFVFVAAPIIAGVDKLLYLAFGHSFLVDWYQYLWPAIKGVGITPFIFFLVAGIVEVVAGLVVAFRPDLGGYLVMFWLWGIVINLLLMRNYYDIALRDFGLSLGALSLARLSQGLYGRPFEAATPQHEPVREYAAPPSTS